MSNRTRERGFLLAESIVAITLVSLIMAGLGITVIGFARFNRYQWARQQCIAAAQAQLDSLTATDQPFSHEDIQRLWPDVTVKVDRSAGEGQWEGLELLQVQASVDTHPRPTTVRLARYLLTKPHLEEGEQSP
ncbi:MAG: type II secretion system protein [Sedimentisphaerales bacterium]|nr:type II secretion system protein [Sedimentisphaerales bacterium]